MQAPQGALGRMGPVVFSDQQQGRHLKALPIRIAEPGRSHRLRIGNPSRVGAGNIMKSFIADSSPRKAALVVGIAFITSLLLVTLVDDLLLANFVIPGDTAALARDIEADRRLFGFAVVGYLIVLALDSTIGLALYAVLRPASEDLALATSALRLLYAFTLIIGLFALSLQIIDAYGYASLKLVGYVFFAFHILVLGCAVLKSDYMPNSLGALLVLASFTYIVFFVDVQLPESLAIITMLIMASAELLLSIWLIVRRNTLPERPTGATP